MYSFRTLVTLTVMLISSSTFASDKSVISEFINRAVTPLDNMIMEQDDYYTTTISVASYDIEKTNSLITPYTGLIVIGGVRKHCFKEESSEILSCEQSSSTNRNRTIHFEYNHENRWLPVKVSFRDKDTSINEILLEVDGSNPLAIYLSSFFEKK